MPALNIGDKIRIIRDDIDNFYVEGELGEIVEFTFDSDVPEVKVEFYDASRTTYNDDNTTWWVLVDDLEVLVEKRE